MRTTHERMKDEATRGDEYPIPDLSWVTGFSYEDVEFNSRGRLSPAQLQEQKNEIEHDLIVLGVAAFAAIPMYAVAGWLGAASILIMVVGMGINLFVVGRRALAGDVIDAVGDVWTARESDPVRYYVHIDGWKLEITRDAYDALIPGGPYRIFYIEGPDCVVGCEVLPGWRPLTPPTGNKSWWNLLSIEIGR